MSSIEDLAREEAEARRQKILELSEDRIGIVTGEKPSDETSKSTTSSRMAAMRRRRFKKAAKAGSEEEDMVDENVPKESSSAVVSEESVEATTANPADDEVIEEVNTPGVEADSSQPKYVGVAKMRRRLIKEKQRQAEADQHPTPHEHQPDDDNDKYKKKAATVAKSGSLKKRMERLPVMMYGVTVLLLFAAGLDVGWQRMEAVTVVHTDLAPRQLGFMKLMPVYTQNSNLFSFRKENEHERSSLSVSDHEEVDEFSQTDKAPKRELDPLFGIDLDLYTKGPGAVKFLGRFAVKVHRINLAIFYYFPRRILISIYTLCVQMVRIPPLLCFLALLIRQFLGRLVLGAKAPEKVQSDESKEQQKDFMSMIKNFISGIVLRTFPTAVSIYDAWVHLRSDMYVVLCGVFVGLALSHSTPGSVLPEATLTPVVTEEPAKSKATDEL